MVNIKNQIVDHPKSGLDVFKNRIQRTEHLKHNIRTHSSERCPEPIFFSTGSPLNTRFRNDESCPDPSSLTWIPPLIVHGSNTLKNVWIRNFF